MNHPSKIDIFIERLLAGVATGHAEIECTGINLNEVGVYGRTPLMVAAAEGLLAVVEVLVRNGASVHAMGNYQVTALHEACANGQTEVANYLISLGAKVDAETNDGVTPLMSAAAWGNIDTVKVLLENQADRAKVDRFGATAADIAMEKGEVAVADLIDSYPRITSGSA